MQMSGITMRRGIAGVLAAGVLGGVAATTVALPTASADADCTVSGLSTAIGTVGAQTSQWFARHPDANQAVTNAGGQGGGAEGAIRNYFIAHPSEWAELQGIAQPLRSLREQCGSDVAPADIARLYDAMAS
jgi:heme-binding protein